MGNESVDPRARARPLRSVAFAPANRGEVIRAVAAAGPDGLVLDLEDGTPRQENLEAVVCAGLHGVFLPEVESDPQRARAGPGVAAGRLHGRSRRQGWRPGARDPEGLRRFALQTRRLGYTGMMVAHYPGHMPAVNGIFTPTPAEVAHHREVIRIVAEGEARGDAMPEKDGHIIDPARVKPAGDRLELARRLGVA